MASTSAQKASSSTSTPLSYDVFISFRGEDTRKNFTDHLYTTLVAYGLHTFRDDEELEKGGDIADDLERAIEESNIFVIIFSKNYANSSWCLRELVKIVECTTQKQSTILPIFYHVNPSDVRKQSGSYGDAFVDHEKDADEKKLEMIQKWRTALNQVASLSGVHVEEQYEEQVVKEITDDIIRRLDRKPLNVGKNIVGMDNHLEKLKSLINIDLNEVRVIEIYGIGGIGKTTIAKVVYNDISSQFDGSSFLNNVRERSKDNALQLQQELLNGILKGKSSKVSNKDEGIQKIERSLRSKSVLVVFDDVDNLKQLENLVEYSWFGPRSRIIITTRQRNLLTKYGVKESYEVQKLNVEEAIQLFSWCAFQQNLPKKTYEDLFYCAVDYANGLPLALEVLGSFLFGKTISEWRSALEKLKTTPHMDIQNVLKISYDGLDDEEKGLFLDIACFFKGEDKDFVSRILDDQHCHAEIGIRVLHDKCLISISENKLDVHDLLQQMGWAIVRRECPREPGRRSRLWEHGDVYRVLTRNLGTEEIEGIFLDMSRSEHIQFTTKAFRMMNRLRLLKIHQDATYNSMVESFQDVDPSQVHFSDMHEDFEFPCFDLRYFHWDGYSLPSLPMKNFCADNLVELNLRFSKITQLWEEKVVLEKLKVINLSYSQHLEKFPDFSSVPNLEILILEGCTSLENLPKNFCSLRSLKSLKLDKCSNLNSFPEIKGGHMENLRELRLNSTAIEELSSSIGHLNALEHLKLTNCKNLVSLPDSLCNLTSLKILDAEGCSKLKKLPKHLGQMQSLEALYLTFVSCELPCLSGLCSLRSLNLSRCTLTQGVIQSKNCLSSLEELIMRDCKGMEVEILHHIFHLSSLKTLDLSNCDLMAGEIPIDICHLSSFEEMYLAENHCCRIPAGISQLSRLEGLGLRHCKKLLPISELPSSLRLLDAHSLSGTLSSPSLVPLHSLVNCFKSAIQDFECGRNTGYVAEGDSIYLGRGICIFIPGSEVIMDLPQNLDQDNLRVSGFHYLGNEFFIRTAGSSGNPERINESNMEDVIMNLPKNWYQNNGFLGFAFWCVYGPVDDESVHTVENQAGDEFQNESENESGDEWVLDSVHTVENESHDEFHNESENESGDKSELESGNGFDTVVSLFSGRFECRLFILGDHQLDFVDSTSLLCSCECFDGSDGLSDQVMVICYPKVAIDKRYHSDQCTDIVASFKGFYGHDRTLKVKKCGVHPIYA